MIGSDTIRLLGQKRGEGIVETRRKRHQRRQGEEHGIQGLTNTDANLTSIGTNTKNNKARTNKADRGTDAKSKEPHGERLPNWKEDAGINLTIDEKTKISTDASRRRRLMMQGGQDKGLTQTVHRRTHAELIRRNYTSYRQTRLRPTKIPEGGDWHFHDIRKLPNRARRFLFQNVGGFPMDRTARKTQLQEVNQFRAGYIGIMETKLNSQCHDEIRRAKRDIGKNLNGKAVFVSNTDCHTDSTYKPGGMAAILTNDLRSKQNTGYTDPTSLIQVTHLNNVDSPLCVVNVYLPPKNEGPTSSYIQAMNTMRMERGEKKGNTARGALLRQNQNYSK